ncbi:hypothetical protein D3C71_1538810 [compost metagenome]
MVVLAGDGAAWALRMPPVRTRDVAPPARVVAQGDLGLGADEHHRTRHQQLVVRSRRARRQLHLQILPFGLLFGGGDVARRLDEAAELRIRHIVHVHPETADRYLVRRHFIGLRQLVAAAHQEFTPRHPGHPRRSGLAVAQHHLHRLRAAIVAQNQVGRAGGHPQRHPAQKQCADQTRFVSCLFGHVSHPLSSKSNTPLPCLARADSPGVIPTQNTSVAVPMNVLLLSRRLVLLIVGTQRRLSDSERLSASCLS